MDSLLNYETVKYFNNEAWEARRYDEQLLKWEEAATRSQTTLAYLNLGQAAIIALGVTAMMWRAASGVVDGQMTIGDLVLVNAFLIQLYIPLNFLGIVYREIRQALTDIERMFNLLNENQEIADAPDARDLPEGPLQVNFDAVDFAYEANRQILKNLSFAIPPGKTVAVVGHSGRANPRSPACSTVSTMQRAAPSGSTATICASCVRPACGRQSASSRKTPCCSTTPFSTTSITVAPLPRARKSWQRHALPSCMISSSRCRSSTTPRLASAA
jgi:hypothetical protein